MRWWSLIIFASWLLLEKYFLSSDLLLWIHLLILEILEETTSGFPTLAVPQRELETSIKPFKKLTGNHLLVILTSNSEPASKFSSPAYGAIYRISGGFLNATTSVLKMVSRRNFKISKCFHRSKQKNLNFHFLKATKKNSLRIYCT